MKEAYFTPETIRDKAADMLHRFRGFIRRHPAALPMERSALIVLDMQSYFLELSSHAFIPSAPAIVPGINAMIHRFRDEARPVILTRHRNTTDDAGMMEVWWKDLMMPDDPRNAIHPSIDTEGLPVIAKTRYDAFHGTLLQEMLHKSEVKNLVVCGVMTHLCCETTVRSAFMLGFDVYLPVDGTATFNESFHLASLLNLAHGFARLTSVQDLTESRSNP